ncbi:hypothetical protein NPIL_18461 [Nephila pilipes]|uniref:Secreted protein n=1 Tax=Nephila pilipes TaxID=299642 RepID=A0A8X6TPX9_NEPPI|nr:hypothetical protein NPIL_18461 [Nephila pilipes]
MACVSLILGLCDLLKHCFSFPSSSFPPVCPDFFIPSRSLWFPFLVARLLWDKSISRALRLCHQCVPSPCDASLLSLEGQTFCPWSSQGFWLTGRGGPDPSPIGFPPWCPLFCSFYSSLRPVSAQSWLPRILSFPPF